MKKIKVFFAAITLLCSIQITSIIAMQQQNQSPRETTTQSTTSWLSYFTAPLLSLANNITNIFSSIKNYFFPTSKQQPKEVPINTNVTQTKEDTAPQPEKPLLQAAPLIKIIPSPLEQQAEKIADVQLPLLGISYNCANKRLDLIFENTQPRYFQSVDSYQYSPQKKHLLATTIDTSFGQLVFAGALKKTTTKLINPLSNKKEITELKNIKMYDFSPQETKLLFLTSDTTIWQTFGITKPSTMHKEKTGILKKTSNIFTYHIFDIANQKIINSFENATSVSFNNEDEVTVYFEDREIEVHTLNTTLLTSLVKKISGPSTQKSSELYRYFPHENTLELPLTNPQAIFSDIDKFHFSPQKKYVLLEQNPTSSKTVNIIKGINPNLPLIKLINTQTGKSISNFGTPNMLMNDTTNIITYEFSPQETKILLQTRGQYGCKYILFDIEQNYIIDQPLASAQSVRFKSENEFTIVNAQGESKDIRINVKQKTITQKIIQQLADAIGTETTQKITALKNQFAEGFSELARRTAQKQQAKNDDEILFDSIIEESMYIFKTYAMTDKNKANNAIADIITELSTPEESGDIDKQSTIIENYKNYLPKLQKLFVKNLLMHYKNCTQEAKENFVAILFADPHGTVYNQKDKQKTKIKNIANTVTATIKREKTDNQIQDVLIFNSNDPIRLLSTHILKKNIRTILFNPSGNTLVVSYEKRSENTTAPLDTFIQNKNKTFGPYKTKDISIHNSPEIIGLLFLDESTLLLLDEQYTIKSMTILENTNKFQEALRLLKKIETDCLGMKNADVNSTAILTDTFQDILRLEYISGKLPIKYKMIINEKQSQLEEKYQLTFTSAIKNALISSWNSNKNTIKTIVMNLIKPAFSIAILHVLQASTGNTLLDLESLKIPIMSGIAATFAVEYGKYMLNPSLISAITGGSSTAITEQFIPYNKTVTIPTLAPSGILKGAFTASIATEIQLIIAQEGGVEKLIQEYSRDFLLREKKSSSESENEITSLLFSTIKSKLGNEQIASLLTEITYVTIESACIGMGLYFSGLGFAHEKPLTEALYYNALRGVVQGTINYGFIETSNKTGALITIPTAIISASIVSDLTHTAFTTESGVSALIHATTQAVADVIINDSERLTRIVSQTKQKIEQSIRNSWSKGYDLFSTFKENAFIIQDIEEKDIAYGSI